MANLVTPPDSNETLGKNQLNNRQPQHKRNTYRETNRYDEKKDSKSDTGASSPDQNPSDKGGRRFSSTVGQRDFLIPHNSELSKSH